MEHTLLYKIHQDLDLLQGLDLVARRGRLHSVCTDLAVSYSSLGGPRKGLMIFYQLFLTAVIAGSVSEIAMGTFPRFEQCWEAAEILTHNRPGWSARCVRVEEK